MGQAFWRYSGVLGAVMLACAAAPAAAQEPAAPLSGRWVYMEQLTTVADLPVLGDTYSTLRAVVLYDLEESGGRLQGPGQLCTLRMNTDSVMIQTVLPPAFRRAVEVPPLNLELIGDGPQRQVAQPRQLRVVGATLQNPARDALPTRVEDPRVQDQDRDGHPGVTVQIAGLVDGDIYLVQRQWNELSGAVRSPDRIEGQLRFGREEQILGTTNSSLADPPPPRPVYKKSFFRLVRVAPGTSCGDLRDAFARL